MSGIEVFTNGEFRVRTTQDADGTVWFVARDVAEALEYSAATVNNNISNLFGNVPSMWSANKRIIVRSENGTEQ